jgi:uncharacterized spore protein YtfJ
MSEQESGFFTEEIHSGRQAFDLIARLLRVAEPGAVYGPPVTANERTVILASELTMSLGAGYGEGRSRKPAAAGDGAAGVAAVGDDGAAGVIESGGGGGGGGFAAGRPVAAIVIEPSGVRVEPVVDVTKLGIALFTTLVAMFLAWSRMRRSLDKAARR